MARNIKSFKKLDTENTSLNKFQDNVEGALQGIINAPIINGTLVKDICLEAGVVNEVHHKLGREPIGWIVVRKRKDSRIWDVQDYNVNPSRTLSIACSHQVTVDIWVF